MAVNTNFYNSYKAKLMNGANIDLDTDPIKVVLLSASYTPDKDTHDFYDDLTNEIGTGNGYTTGGYTLVSPTVTQDNTDDEGVFDSADPTWTITASRSFKYAVFYKSTGISSTSPLICYVDLDATYTIVNGVFTLTLNSEGLINIT